MSKKCLSDDGNVTNGSLKTIASGFRLFALYSRYLVYFFLLFCELSQLNVAASYLFIPRRVSNFIFLWVFDLLSISYPLPTWISAPARLI